jgi:Flp pilus assembly protein TadG
MRKVPVRRQSSRKGAALVELALMLTVLVLLTLVALDFARFAYYYVATSNAAGAAARFAAFHPATPTTMNALNAAVYQTAIDDLQGVVGYDVNNVTVPNVVIATDPAPFHFQRVRVRVDYAFSTLFTWPGIPSQFTMSRSVEMRIVR